ncbi:MAG: glycosyltransferase [Propioniciclava sp.]|uniref:glycosyltransferase n=1 Tax=Propioniciclava sp. TaxID=2038686 RepID=UPI0039E48DBD
MRILHVTECYGAGVGRAVNLRALATPEFEHHLLWAGEESPAFQEHWASAEALPDGLWKRILATRRRVTELKPDLVHAHSSWAGVYARALKLPVPVLYEPHCFKFDDPATGSLVRSLYKHAESALARNCAAIGVLSPHEERLARSLRPTLSTVFLPNTPVVTQATIEECGEPDADTPGVVMVGRVAPQKDPHYFIDVVRRLRETIPRLRATWVGDGEPKLIAALHEADITVTGWLGERDVARTLINSSVYVHTARYEGFPLSVLDAAAAGCPIVVRDIPPFEGTALIRGDSPGAVADLAGSIIKDPAARQAAQKASAALLATMNTESLSRSLRHTYHDLQAGR